MMSVWLATEQGVITYANSAYDRTLMALGSSAVGQCLDDLFSPEYAQEYHRNNAEVLATNAEVEALEDALLTDGTVGTFLVRKFPVAVGNQRWVGGIAANITALRHAESHLQELVARWQLAVESAADGVWEWNVANHTVVLSPQWKAMLGYDDQTDSQAMGQRESFVHPDDRDSVKRNLEAHLQGQTPLYQHEHRLRCRDGSYCWVLNRGKVIDWDANSAVFGAVYFDRGGAIAPDTRPSRPLGGHPAGLLAVTAGLSNAISKLIAHLVKINRCSPSGLGSQK